MLIELIERHATDAPDHPAIIADGQRIAWGMLRQRVMRLAGGLREQGVEPGQAVGVWMGNSPAFVISALAVMRLGAAAVPQAIDAKESEVLRAMECSGARTLLAEDACLEQCRSIAASRPALRVMLETRVELGRPSIHGLSEQGSIPGQGVAPSPSDPAIELLTSGTTGLPRSVLRTHGQLARLATMYAAATGLTCHDRILPAVAMTHGMGLCTGLLAWLACGATLVLERTLHRRRLLRWIAAHRVTCLSASPFIVSILARTPVSEPIDLSSVRLAVTGGEPLREKVWQQASERLGWAVRQSYGSSETGMVAVNVEADPRATRESVGRPLEGVAILIVGESGQRLPDGAVGRIMVRSPLIGRTRVGGPGESMEPAPLADGEGWFDTGDLGFLDAQGRLHVTGRDKAMISVAGRKVWPGEIQSVLLGHPRVCRVDIGVEHDAHGVECIRATVETSAACTVEQLLEHCRKHMAEYKAPRRIEIRPRN